MATDVLIVGGGVIGLSVAWQAARAGLTVELLERDEIGRGASWTAAGMLAPQAEAGFEEIELLRLAQESLRLYPNFLRDLREDSGVDVPLDKQGTLMVGLHRDDTERLRRLFAYRESLDLPVKWLDGKEARDLEPLLSPRVVSGIWIPDDTQVNNREMIGALRAALLRRGVTLREHTPVESFVLNGGTVHGVRSSMGEHRADSIVLAAGCWSKSIAGLPPDHAPPVRPVKGQMVSLTITDACRLTRVVRAPDVYLVPKSDGRLLVGATEEEMGFDISPTAGPVMKLLQRAWEAVPGVYELPIRGIDVGLRPGSRDHRPIIGPTPVERLVFATGHYRHGILLAPITAYEVVSLLNGGKTSELLDPFLPSRFVRRAMPNAVTI